MIMVNTIYCTFGSSYKEKVILMTVYVRLWILTKTTLVIILQYIHISNQYVVYFKLIQWYNKHISMKLKS